MQEHTHASDWAAVSAGGDHTCAVKTDHTLWCWGNNDSGELGDGGTTTDSAVPVQEHTHASDWAAVSAGGDHTCAVKTDHTLWCWGNNDSGELGDGTTTSSAMPVQEHSHASDWAGVSAAVNAGEDYTCAVKTDHTLWCWGYNARGELGDGTTTDSAVPVREHSHASDWAAVSARGDHTCTVKTDHTLWCWGDNGTGELGIGVAGYFTTPVQVTRCRQRLRYRFQ